MVLEIFKCSQILAFAPFPLKIYRSARFLGFSRMANVRCSRFSKALSARGYNFRSLLVVVNTCTVFACSVIAHKNYSIPLPLVKVLDQFSNLQLFSYHFALGSVPYVLKRDLN